MFQIILPTVQKQIGMRKSVLKNTGVGGILTSRIVGHEVHFGNNLVFVIEVIFKSTDKWTIRRSLQEILFLSQCIIEISSHFIAKLPDDISRVITMYYFHIYDFY